ncbi:hypothetical protein S245_008165 [Arachis hypogaea]|nr:uncharacterized protein DS421_3g76030 [Arachis hypogaea]
MIISFNLRVLNFCDFQLKKYINISPKPIIISQKISFSNLVKGVAGEQAVRSSLMALPNNSIQLKCVSHLLQTTIKAIAEPHHMLHIISISPQQLLHKLQEPLQVRWKNTPC